MKDRGEAAGAAFFAAYVGPSMNPTLCEPEILEIVPCGGGSLRAGDVVFFLPPGSDRPVVHRVARVTAAGISTRGDNNAREDHVLLPLEDIRGRVVAAWRGRKRREIAGGFRGRWNGRWLRVRRLMDHGVSPLLHHLYRSLSLRGRVARCLPASFRPRVVVFQDQGKDRFRLLLGERIIGRYEEQERQWRIQRPFRLLVDERTLPGWTEP